MISAKKRKGIDFHLWKGIVSYALRYRKTTIALALLAVLMAGIDTAFPLITRYVIDAVKASGFQPNQSTRSRSTDGVERTKLSAAEGRRHEVQIVDNGGAGASLRLAAAAYLLLLAALPLTVYAFIRKAGKLSTHVSHDIRRDAFARLQELDAAFYDTHHSGWLLARMTSDCDRLARIVAWGTLDLFWGFTLISSIVCVMIWLDARLAAIALSTVPILVIVSRSFQRRILGSARKVRSANSRLTASFNEGIAAIRTTKVLGREADGTKEFETLSGEMYDHSLTNALQSALYLPVVLTLGSIGTGLALYAGSGSLLSGAMSLGTLIAFLHYTGQFFDPVNEVAALFANMQMAQAAAERVLGLIATEPSIRDSQAVLLRTAATRKKGRTPGMAEDGYKDRVARIELDHVAFAYGAGRPVLDDFSLTVEPGETIALVGPTGAGKSTIVSLLARFIEPSSGAIRFDGIDIRDRSLAWLRSQFGMVLQTPHLFRGTVRENILYGKPSAGMGEVRRAARLARVDELVERFKEGYETEVGEGGSRLSVGQRQLVTFARALLKDPRILILDEATSSVDMATEIKIQAALEELLKGRTSFVIAHRLRTIRSADRIILVADGGIVEQGSHTELMAMKGRYFAMHEENVPGSLVRSGGVRQVLRRADPKAAAATTPSTDSGCRG